MTSVKVNLTQNPSAEDFAELLSQYDDNAGHHILWVDHSANVFIDLLRDDQTPIRWAEESKDRCKFRMETFAVGGGYVGKEAAQDIKYVIRILRELTDDWYKDKKGLVDY